MKTLIKKSGYLLDLANNIWINPTYDDNAYNDGDEVETRIASIIIESSNISVLSIELRQQCTDWPSMYHLNGTRANIIRPFENSLKGDILEIGAGCGAITRYLGECGANILAIEGSRRRAAIARSRTRDLENVTVLAEKFDQFQCNHQFDVITLIGVLEYANLFTSGDNPPFEMLKRIRSLLKLEGKLIIAIENQLGLKYFAGFSEDHLGQPMIGIEGRYRKDQPQTFGRNVLTDMLKQAEFTSHEFLAPFPDYKLPISILTEKGFASENFDAAAFAWQSARRDSQLPTYCTFSLELAWQVIFSNKLGLDIANSFLIIASPNEQQLIDEKILAYHYSTDRIADYCKEMVFINNNDNTIYIKYNHFGTFHDDIGKENHSLIKFVCPDSDKYIFGKSLALKFINIVTKDGWSIDQIARLLWHYLSALKSFVKSAGIECDITKPYTKLPGDFFDIIPQNIIIAEDGNLFVIDKEWQLVGTIEVAHLLFRSLLILINSISRFGLNEFAVNMTRHQFIDSTLIAIGMKLQEEDYARYILLEADIQEAITGRMADNFLNWGKYDPLPTLNLSQVVVERDKQIAKLNQVVAEVGAQLTYRNQVIVERDKQIVKLNQSLHEKDIHNEQDINLNPELNLSLAATNWHQPTSVSITTNTINWNTHIEKVKIDYCNTQYQELANFLNSDQNFIIENNEFPLVSIILILYNHSELTFACLKSIRETTDIKIEVIIVDNASSDSTGELLNRLNGNCKIIRNNENLHFIHACNQAIEVCSGEFILLLNNDAILLPNAVHNALQVFNEESNVGAVGSKIISLNGTLQEAGSIIWRDGSCYGYGRGDNPTAPQFMFRRSVDYCSAAFLLIRRETYLILGGFDTDYAPAYYEDADLCLRLRYQGLDVIYEPSVQILHYEFASSENSQQAIALQRKNRNIFVNKHAKYLATRAVSDAPNILQARNTDKRLRLLYIDDRVPHLQLGSGFPRANFMLKTLAEHYAVTLFPFFLHGEPWETVYSDIPKRVEVINNGGKNNFVRFLQKRKDYYAVILVSRPHNMRFFAAAYQQIYGSQRGPVVIYDAEAIFALREAMQLQILKGITSNWEQAVSQELALSLNADRVLVVSEHERKLFLTQNISAVDVVGHALSVFPTETNFAQRNNILFVGNLDYDYSPNVDSIVWFVEKVLTKLVKELPDLKLILVGSNKSKQLHTIQHPAVHFVGQVNDVIPFYAKCRIFIAPTRFAAGIPYKVHEATAHGIPVVCSELIQWQLGWNDGEVLAADIYNPAAFAKQCLRLYQDEICWEQVRQRALQRVQTECAVSQVQNTLLNAVTQALQGRDSNLKQQSKRCSKLESNNLDTATTLTYVWELGYSFGHIGAFLPVAKQLRTNGMNINWAVAQTQIAYKLLHQEGWRWLQAPLPRELRLDKPPLSFADIMLRFGFADSAGLLGLVVAWRELFRLSNTKLVLADHAPAAILAARTLDLPVMLYSYGFCVPPPLTPTPSLRPWQPVEKSILLNIERPVIESINAVLHEFKKTAIDSVAELYNVHETTLLTYPDVDHFKNERSATVNYWGSILYSATGELTTWPKSNGPRIFAYLRRESPYSEMVLKILYTRSIAAIVVFPDAPQELKLRYVHAPTMILVSKLIDVSRIIHEADVAITYGGHGLTSAFLLAGKPLLVLPTQLEQFILAKRIVDLGAGLMLHPKESPGDVEMSIKQLLDDVKFANAAQAVAARNAVYTQENVIQNIVQRIQQLYCE